MNVLRIYSNERRRTIPFFRYLRQSPYEGVFREDTVQTKRSSITASLSSEECEFGSRPKKAAADSTSAAAIVIPLHKAPSATKRTFSLNRVQSRACASFAEARKLRMKFTGFCPFFAGNRIFAALKAGISAEVSLKIRLGRYESEG